MKCDAKTFARMYEDIYKDLYRFALCLMRDVHDAEDAVSDSVISAYEHVEGLKKSDAFRSWIFTILANTCRRRLREKAKKIQAVELISEETADYTEDTGLQMDVRNAFEALSEEEQLVVGLSVIGGYQSSEIGEMLHLNPNTVRSKRSRALEKMSRVLE